MARQTRSKYVEAAQAALKELGGGPIPSSVLIDAIVESKLLPPREYLYHNVLRRVRQSELFDTSVRGQVALAAVPAEQVEPPAEQAEAPVEEAELLVVDKLTSEPIGTLGSEPVETSVEPEVEDALKRWGPDVAVITTDPPEEG